MTTKLSPTTPGFIICPICKVPVLNDPSNTNMLASVKCTKENFEKYICTIEDAQDAQRQSQKDANMYLESIEGEFETKRSCQPEIEYRFCLIACPICVEGLVNLVGPKFTKVSIGKMNSTGRTYIFKFDKANIHEYIDCKRDATPNSSTESST